MGEHQQQQDSFMALGLNGGPGHMQLLQSSVLHPGRAVRRTTQGLPAIDTLCRPSINYNIEFQTDDTCHTRCDFVEHQDRDGEWGRSAASCVAVVDQPIPVFEWRRCWANKLINVNVAYKWAVRSATATNQRALRRKGGEEERLGMMPLMKEEALARCWCWPRQERQYPWDGQRWWCTAYRVSFSATWIREWVFNTPGTFKATGSASCGRPVYVAFAFGAWDCGEGEEGWDACPDQWREELKFEAEVGPFDVVGSWRQKRARRRMKIRVSVL
ncbi:hypothetical protein BKA70DRAFT_1508782 [Coprinopsis sp. MPI-PUGE-AT-0042]|nr:hypothetical protein BKA70DRAFT_1508782 [Coprinopsis sp. MPI-PUGE-AT-0042]